MSKLQRRHPLLVRQATQPFFIPVSTTENKFGKIDKTYVVCEKDKISSLPRLKRNFVERVNCNKAISINTGHVPHVENPELLAETILKSNNQIP